MACSKAYTSPSHEVISVRLHLKRLPLPAFPELRGGGLKGVTAHPALPVCDLFRRRDELPLTMLEDVDELRRRKERFVCSCIEPRVTPTESLHIMLLLRQINA